MENKPEEVIKDYRLLRHSLGASATSSTLEEEIKMKDERNLPAPFLGSDSKLIKIGNR